MNQAFMRPTARFPLRKYVCKPSALTRILPCGVVAMRSGIAHKKQANQSSAAAHRPASALPPAAPAPAIPVPAPAVPATAFAAAGARSCGCEASPGPCLYQPPARVELAPRTFSNVRAPAMPSMPVKMTHSASVSSMGGAWSVAAIHPTDCRYVHSHTMSGYNKN